MSIGGSRPLLIQLPAYVSINWTKTDFAPGFFIELVKSAQAELDGTFNLSDLENQTDIDYHQGAWNVAPVVWDGLREILKHKHSWTLILVSTEAIGWSQWLNWTNHREVIHHVSWSKQSIIDSAISCDSEARPTFVDIYNNAKKKVSSINIYNTAVKWEEERKRKGSLCFGKMLPSILLQDSKSKLSAGSAYVALLIRNLFKGTRIETKMRFEAMTDWWLLGSVEIGSNEFTTLNLSVSSQWTPDIDLGVGVIIPLPKKK